MTDLYYANVGKPPTKRQKQLHKHLIALCHSNGLSTQTGLRLKFMHDYSKSIDILKKRLKDAGVKWGEELDHGE